MVLVKSNEVCLYIGQTKSLASRLAYPTGGRDHRMWSDVASCIWLTGRSYASHILFWRCPERLVGVVENELKRITPPLSCGEGRTRRNAPRGYSWVVREPDGVALLRSCRSNAGGLCYTEDWYEALVMLYGHGGRLFGNSDNFRDPDKCRDSLTELLTQACLDEEDGQSIPDESGCYMWVGDRAVVREFEKRRDSYHQDLFFRLG